MSFSSWSDATLPSTFCSNTKTTCLQIRTNICKGVSVLLTLSFSNRSDNFSKCLRKTGKSNTNRVWNAFGYLYDHNLFREKIKHLAVTVHKIITQIFKKNNDYILHSLLICCTIISRETVQSSRNENVIICNICNNKNCQSKLIKLPSIYLFQSTKILT